MSEIGDLAAGKAGEYLVCADLILGGYTAFPSEQGLPYDVIVDVGGRLRKVQVKTTRGVRAIPQRANNTSAYLFYVGKCGKGGRGSYGAADVDLFALVALDSRTIAYLPAGETRTTMLFRSPLLKGSYADEVEAVRRASLIRDRLAGMANIEAAERNGYDPSVASRVFLRRPGKFKGSPYLDEFPLADALSALTANDNFQEAIQ